MYQYPECVGGCCYRDNIQTLYWRNVRSTCRRYLPNVHGIRGRNNLLLLVLFDHYNIQAHTEQYQSNIQAKYECGVV